MNDYMNYGKCIINALPNAEIVEAQSDDATGDGFVDFLFNGTLYSVGIEIELDNERKDEAGKLEITLTKAPVGGSPDEEIAVFSEILDFTVMNFKIVEFVKSTLNLS